MTGGTISKTLTSSLTLGSGGYLGPLTITASGAIEPAASYGSGLVVPSTLSAVTVLNQGSIDAGPGGSQKQGRCHGRV